MKFKQKGLQKIPSRKISHERKAAARQTRFIASNYQTNESKNK